MTGGTRPIYLVYRTGRVARKVAKFPGGSVKEGVLVDPGSLLGRLTPAVAVLAVAALTASSSPASASSSPAGLRSQLAQVAQSPSAMQVEQGMAALVTDPAVTALATELLRNHAAELTGFQKGYLKALLAAAPYGQVISARLEGKPLTAGQARQLGELAATLHENPSIQKMISAGASLKDSPSLPSDITNVIAENNASGPGPFPGTFGHPNLESLVQDWASVRNSAAFQSFASSVSPLERDPRFLTVLQGQHPAVVTDYLPVPAFQALLLPNDRDPSVLDWVKDALEVTGGIAALIAAVALLPEVAIPAGIAAWAAIYAGGAAVGIGVIDTYVSIRQAEDCDSDNDPGDPADVSGGVECP